MSEEKPVRFQDCPRYVQLWRYRWYLVIPYYAFSIWGASLLAAWKNPDDRDEFSLDLRAAWGIGIGLAQNKMHWWYTWDEVKTRLDSVVKSASSKRKETP